MSDEGSMVPKEQIAYEVDEAKERAFLLSLRDQGVTVFDDGIDTLALRIEWDDESQL